MPYCANGTVWVEQAQSCVPMNAGVANDIPIQSQGGTTTSTNSNTAWWSGESIKGYAEGVSAIWNAVSGKPSTVVYHQTPQTTSTRPDNSWIAWVVGVLGAIIILFMLFFFLGRSKK